MSVNVCARDRIGIDAETVREAAEVPMPDGATLVVRLPSGEELVLTPNLQRMLLGALSEIARHGTVSIGRVPDELTSTMAADMLGVSRPTLMKWAREGLVASFKVGSHTRFRRDDVLALRWRRDLERRAAFGKLRDLDAEHEEFLDA